VQIPLAGTHEVKLRYKVYPGSSWTMRGTTANDSDCRFQALRYRAPEGPASTEVFLNASPITNLLGHGVKVRLTAAVNVAFGDVCYINSSGKCALIDADGIATMSGIVMCVDSTITADNVGNWIFMGTARNDAWSWTVGVLIYGSTTGTSGNTMTQTKPTGVDDVVQVLGVALSATVVYFAPQLAQVELLA